MIIPPHYHAMVKAAAALAAVAALSLGRAWIVWRYRWASGAGAGRRCARLALEHPQTVGVFLVAGCAMVADLALVCWVAVTLAPYAWGIYLFLPAALVGLGAALGMGLSAAWSAAFFAMRRVLGEAATFGGLFAALARQEFLSGIWARSNPFVLPAALSDGCDPAMAARRAANFLQQAPQTLAAVLPLRQRAMGAVVAALAGLAVLAGFLSLPVLSNMGYPVPMAGLGAYPLALALLSLAWCAAWLSAAFQLACAFIFAGAVYVYGTGTGTARERVLAKLPAEWVWPAR